MYLSFVQLEGTSVQVQRDIANAYAMHQTLCWVFAENGQAVPRFLWRLRQVNASEYVLYTLSPHAPKWHTLPAGYTRAEVEVSQPQPWLEGQRLMFSISFNPTVARKTHPEDKQSRRHGVFDPEEQRQWLHRQAERQGVDILLLDICSSERVSYYKAKTKQQLILGVVEAVGMLQVRDADLFWQSWPLGVGRGKAFGLGLWILAQPQ